MRRHFISIYLTGLIGFAIIVVAYTFYIKNTGTEPLSAVDFPGIPTKNHLGQYKTIDDFKGKIILVDFWFSTCPPCLEEMKYFPELLERYDDLVIMSFSIDSESHTLKLLEEKPAPWNFLVNDNPHWTFYNVDKKEKNGYVDLLKVNSFPAYFLIDREGNLLSSPKNAIYSVEKVLGGLTSLQLSFKYYVSSITARKIIKAFLLFHLLVVIVLPGFIFFKK